MFQYLFGSSTKIDGQAAGQHPPQGFLKNSVYELNINYDLSEFDLDSQDKIDLINMIEEPNMKITTKHHNNTAAHCPLLKKHMMHFNHLAEDDGVNSTADMRAWCQDDTTCRQFLDKLQDTKDPDNYMDEQFEWCYRNDFPKG